MKKVKGMLLMMGCLLIFTGCNNQEKTVNILDEASREVDEMDLTEKEDNANKSVENLNTTEVDSGISEGSKGEVIEITEKMYVTYINDIYTNLENYKGKKIKLEGMFTSAYDERSKETYYFVYRTGPGCCGNDGSMCGFEFTTTDKIPMENDWIEVTGTLDAYEQDDFLYLTLRDSQVVIKEERGLEVVYQ